MKSEWEGIAADAGQMFESIDSGSVMSAARSICADTDAQSGQDTVAVLRHRSRRAFLGGACVRRSASSRTFSHDEIAGCLAGALSARYVAVGDLVAEMSEVPIGG